MPILSPNYCSWKNYDYGACKFERIENKRYENVKVLILSILIIVSVALLLNQFVKQYSYYHSAGNTSILPISADKAYTVKNAILTAYNTVPEQTDSSPCISASGDDICGRDDVMANNCLPLGTYVQYMGKVYQVLDRKASKYGCEWYDISFDKDFKNAINFGVKKAEIKIYETKGI